MRRRRKTKIVATLGPASSKPEQVRALFEAGADVFRVNMSHTDHKHLNALVSAVRAEEKTVGRPIGILADLQGPKLRLGKLKGGSARLHDGATVRIVRSEEGDAEHLPLRSEERRVGKECRL